MLKSVEKYMFAYIMCMCISFAYYFEEPGVSSNFYFFYFFATRCICVKRSLMVKKLGVLKAVMCSWMSTRLLSDSTDCVHSELAHKPTA